MSQNLLFSKTPGDPQAHETLGSSGLQAFLPEWGLWCVPPCTQGLSLPATDILREVKVTPESAEIRQRGSKVYSQELLEIITVLLIINE